MKSAKPCRGTCVFLRGPWLTAKVIIGFFCFLSRFCFYTELMNACVCLCLCVCVWFFFFVLNIRVWSWVILNMLQRYYIFFCWAILVTSENFPETSFSQTPITHRTSGFGLGRGYTALILNLIILILNLITGSVSWPQKSNNKDAIVTLF